MPEVRRRRWWYLRSRRNFLLANVTALTLIMTPAFFSMRLADEGITAEFLLRIVFLPVFGGSTFSFFVWPFIRRD
jgi:hypothetical protein